MLIKTKRKKRVRAKLKGKFRLSVFRTPNHIYAQIIDTQKGVTLVSAKSSEVEKQKGKILIAHKTGLLIAKKAKEKEVEKVVFDRGSYAYHGRVKALAEGAKEGGLKL